MKYFNNKYSPTDLTLFMQSPFASWMNRFALQFPNEMPERDNADNLIGLLQTKGQQHEQIQEELFKSQGLSVLKINAEITELKKQYTLEAMKKGIDVIAQAYLEQQPFSGFADFLVKITGESIFGNYHYEVWDTKLSRQAKPEFIVQLCCYTEMLEVMQGKKTKKYYYCSW